MLNDIKEGLLEALPRNLAERLFLVRNAEKIFHAEVLEDLYIDLGVSQRNRLWVDRLSKKFGHESGLCQWLQEHLKQDEVFFDVGSCYGFFPALISALRPKAQIHAFEANWRQFIYLRNNAARNSIGAPWHIINQFVGEKDDAQMVSMDAYCTTMGITPSLVKCDVDGAEIHVLKGATEIIQNRKTEFLIEVHPHYLPKFGSDVDEILSFFSDNYKIKVLPQIRDDNTEWSDDLSLLKQDDNPYIYAAPPEIARFD